ncbi:NAD(P)-binding protein [Parvularcula sp. ZS-1/3]|uniref:NAD(P)-binding protein n=1 Tax=Parvularcula mediterranea TaxID=2732508 RepID=A0A7Y3W4Z1_9PROT|nr:hydroxysqualene dehydroxylase HpnE [Parvularcula mediterranea]NNU15696.1 NAD(P)-binding protein [Parvularcula mediterranea]
MSGHTHIIGAGLAGLSAALHLLERGQAVTVHEGSGQAGGRCRSYEDARLGRVIDNGNHLVLSGNISVRRYLALAGVPDALCEAPEAKFPFADVETRERWSVHMNDGALPWWPLVKDRRPKGVSLGAMLGAGAILRAGDSHTIADLCGAEGPAKTRFWEPMSLAVMNLPPEKASAKLMRATALEAWRNGRLARPMFAPYGLGPALIDPALAKLEEAGSPVRFGSLLRKVEEEEGRATALHFARGEPVSLGAEDDVILAIPAHRLADIFPESAPPVETSSILNAHFLVNDPSVLEGKPPLVGVVGGLTQWIFLKGDIVSLTVSAADHVEGAEGAEEALLSKLWSETRKALDLPETLAYKAGRLVREKRATFLQTPENVKKRPKQETRLRNLVLAGDFVDTGLPATIEGAVRSGERAARILSE